MLADRGFAVDHTLFRRVQAYADDLERRLGSHLRRRTGSWRVDETHIRVKGAWAYQYRAVAAYAALRHAQPGAPEHGANSPITHGSPFGVRPQNLRKLAKLLPLPPNAGLA